jgi:multisubunit Na+/H+ antiporter MnhB subunit
VSSTERKIVLLAASSVAIPVMGTLGLYVALRPDDGLTAGLVLVFGLVLFVACDRQARRVQSRLWPSASPRFEAALSWAWFSYAVIFCAFFAVAGASAGNWGQAVVYTGTIALILYVVVFTGHSERPPLSQTWPRSKHSDDRSV